MDDQRGGTRIPLKTRATVRYGAGDKQRAFKFPVKDLDTNAVSLVIPTNHSINRDFHRINGQTISIEFESGDFPTRRLEGFLYRVERLRSNSARWVFFFDRKIDPEHIAEQIQNN